MKVFLKKLEICSNKFAQSNVYSYAHLYRIIISKYLYNAGKYNFTFVNYPDRNNA